MIKNDEGSNYNVHLLKTQLSHARNFALNVLSEGLYNENVAAVFVSYN